MAKWLERHCEEDGCTWWTRQDRVEWLDYFEKEHRRRAHADLDPLDSGPWLDRQGDVWTLGADDLLHSPETRPFTREYVEKKWGPLVPVAKDSGVPQ